MFESIERYHLNGPGREDLIGLDGASVPVVKKRFVNFVINMSLGLKS